ncbi:D-isomer specific 2-hydroxyacid dehydrogenase [Hyaloraphidium curvatum]|nr:D-isomer specific 2-hydroxyacid dehydrogenase [Hyaloraphidium curvatum]
MLRRVAQLSAHLDAAIATPDALSAPLDACRTSGAAGDTPIVLLPANFYSRIQSHHADLVPRFRAVQLTPRGEPVDGKDAALLNDALVYVRADGTPAAISERVLAGAPKVRWFHSPSAGVDFILRSAGIRGRLLAPPPRQKVDLSYLSALPAGRTVLTNTPGGTAVPISEFVVMAMLFHAKRVTAHQASPKPAAGGEDDANGKNWWRRGTREIAPTMMSLDGATVVVYGFGGIGMEVGRRCKAFGMRVIGVRRNTEIDAAGTCDVLVGDDKWKEYLPEADYLVISSPLTAATKKLVNKDLLSKLKRGCYVVNIARGEIIDDDDLCAAINSGHLSGAALDVFNPEPLPHGSPLLLLPADRVLLTPHISWASQASGIAFVDRFAAQLRRLLDGQEVEGVIADLDL